MATALRERKSDFVKLFDKTPAGVICPHFYELVLSNGCPYDCAYCYLRLTFRGHKSPVLFTNSWDRVRAEIEAIDQGVFSTGELADSLAVEPPLLQSLETHKAIPADHCIVFREQHGGCAGVRGLLSRPGRTP
ncbi:MAG: hypothetical protein Q8P50_08040 [Bacillota bacterium]|nr:hypothetical protein [Bacillota bacterium]